MNLTWLYIAAVYAIAVWLARRARPELTWRAALFFYAITAVFFWPALAQSYVNLPVDYLRDIPPWTYLTRDYSQINPELNDLTFQIVPWAHQVRESWKSLSAPLWNPLAGSGYPLLANGQSSALSPLRILALPLSLGHAMAAEAAMKLLIALTFMFLYCRRRYSEIASLLAAVTFAFGGFLISWLHFPMVTVACFAPAVLYAIDLLAEKQTYKRFVFAVTIAAIVVVGGHPETAAHLALLCLAYVAWMMWVERPAGLDRKRLILALGATVAVAVLIAMPYLAPVAEHVRKSRRMAELAQHPLTGVLAWGDWRTAVMLLQPHFFGQVPLELPWAPAETEPLGGYTGVLAFASWVAVLAGAIVRRGWRSREMFFALAPIVPIGVVFNWPVFSKAIHFILPMMAHARMRLLLVLLLAILTAAAFDLARRTPLLLGVLAVSVVLLLLVHRVDFPSDYWRDTAIIAMLPSLAVLALATLVAVTNRKAAALALLAAVVVELFTIGRDRNPNIDDKWMYPHTPLLTKLQELLKQQPGRIIGTGAVLYPNLQATFGFEDIRVHDPMAYWRYMKFVSLTTEYNVNTYFAWWEDDINARVLDYLNVRYVVAYRDHIDFADTDRYRLVYHGVDGRIFENRHALPRFYAVRNVVAAFDKQSFEWRLRDMEGWSHTALLDRLEVENQQMHDDFFKPRPENAPLAVARVVESSPKSYRIRASAPRWSLIVSSIPFLPGWKIERNGERIEPIRVNSAFIGFAVPPGESDVRVWYAPWSFWGGAIVSLATILAIGIYGSAARARRYRRASASA